MQEINKHYQVKKLHYITFFKDLKQAIQSIAIKVQTEFDQQHQYMLREFANIDQQIIRNECNKMQIQRHHQFRSIVVQLCQALTTLTEQQPPAIKHQRSNMTLKKAKPQLLPTKIMNGNTAQKEPNSRYFSIDRKGRDMNYRENPAQLRSAGSKQKLSLTESSKICENLDKKIYREALELLDKVSGQKPSQNHRVQQMQEAILRKTGN